MNPTQMARIAHEVYRAYCASVGGDQPLPWDKVSPWQRETAVNDVVVLRKGLMTPHRMHAIWCEHKTRAGWTFGPIEDTVRKTHPHLVPYDALPAALRAKDALLHAVVRNAL